MVICVNQCEHNVDDRINFFITILFKLEDLGNVV